MNLAYVGSEIQ